MPPARAPWPRHVRPWLHARRVYLCVGRHGGEKRQGGSAQVLPCPTPRVPPAGRRMRGAASRIYLGGGSGVASMAAVVGRGRALMEGNGRAVTCRGGCAHARGGGRLVAVKPAWPVWALGRACVYVCARVRGCRPADPALRLPLHAACLPVCAVLLDSLCHATGVHAPTLGQRSRRVWSAAPPAPRPGRRAGEVGGRREGGGKVLSRQKRDDKKKKEGGAPATPDQRRACGAIPLPNTRVTKTQAENKRSGACGTPSRHLPTPPPRRFPLLPAAEVPPSPNTPRPHPPSPSSNTLRPPPLPSPPPPHIGPAPP